MANKLRIPVPSIDTSTWKVIRHVIQARSGSYDNDLVFFGKARAFAKYAMRS